MCYIFQRISSKKKMLTLKNLRLVFSANPIGSRLLSTSGSKLQNVESKVIPVSRIHVNFERKSSLNSDRYGF